MSKPFPYVTLTRNIRPIIQVDIGNSLKHFPLTKAGCLSAGEYLFSAGAASWMNSSSVDHPGDYGRAYRDLDVRELMTQGFENALKASLEPRRQMMSKLMEWCDKNNFVATLTTEEANEFRKLKQQLEQERHDDDRTGT